MMKVGEEGRGMNDEDNDRMKKDITHCHKEGIREGSVEDEEEMVEKNEIKSKKKK